MKEITSEKQFVKWARKNPNKKPAAIQDLDICEHSKLIRSRKFSGSAFLGCEMTAKSAGHIVRTGGLVIPDLEAFEFQLHRKNLYSVDELFDGFAESDPRSYTVTLDYRIYDQYLNDNGANPQSILVSLARRLHDHSITDALAEEIADRKVVAVMGGHGMERSDPYYAKVAILSRQLTKQGFLMVSGGGPGAMEATHLGAYFANRSEKNLHQAIDMLKPRPAGAVPGKEYADPDWLDRAWSVRERYPLHEIEAIKKSKSIGIPTWLYGHEPPAPFATHIAKYFANSVREDGLLAIASHGVIFAPGSAGTTQEIFQDAAQNHYGNQGNYSPMILLGEKHWTYTRPVWQLLSAVAKGKEYGELVALTDSGAEVVRRIQMYDPKVYKKRKN